MHPLWRYKLLTLVRDKCRLYVRLFSLVLLFYGLIHQIHNLFNINFLCHLHLFICHRRVIEFLKPRQMFQYYRSIEGNSTLLGTYRILCQIEHLEILEACQVAEFHQICWNEVPTQVQLPQLVQISQVLHGGDLIDGQCEHFEA